MGKQGNPIPWPQRVELMRILKTVTWIPDPYKEKKGIFVSFNAEKVLRHAETSPYQYNIDFLRSSAGLALISEIIEKLNAHMVPQDDFASLAWAYQRWACEAYKGPNADGGYNKSLIADYASRLKARVNPRN